MSYSATVSFKKLRPEEIQPFLTKLKKTIISSLDIIARQNYTYSPCFDISKELSYTQEVRQKMEAWAAKVFRYRFYFEINGSMLGVFGLPDCVTDLFDATIYFQDSCDQNYAFDTWNGIPEFEEVARKWQSYSDEDIDREMAKRGYEDVGREIAKRGDTRMSYEYYRRSFCYNDIYMNYVYPYLMKDSITMHLSVFGFYDYPEIERFCVKCIELTNK